MSQPLDLFKELAKFPAYTSAQFQSKNVVRVTSRIPDFDRNRYRTSTSTYVVDGDNVFPTFAADTPEIVLSTVSESGRRLAVFREVTESGSTKRFVEIWAGNTLEASQEVTKTHGAFYTDDIFSLVSFSPSEKALVYTAELKVEEEKNKESLDNYYFVPPLGEAYPGKKKPGIHLFRWDSDKPFVKTVRPSKESVLLTQPIFVKEDQLAAIGYSYTADHRLLGVKHCPNRLASIYGITIPTQAQDSSDADIQGVISESWTPIDLSCRCPRIVKTNGIPTHLSYIANPVGGPHASCSTLHFIALQTGKESFSTSIVEDPKPDEFPGLYTISIPAQPLLALNGTSVTITSTWRSRTTVVAVSEKGVVNLTPDEDGGLYSWTLLATDGVDQLLASRSSLQSPPELLLGKVSLSGKVQWTSIVKPSIPTSIQGRLSSLELSIEAVKGRAPVETIILKDRNAPAPLPCVHLIHGGPHGATTTAFNVTVIALAFEGYVVSCPNYTGSVGFGDKYVRKLLGSIGTLDVEDCIQTVRQLTDAGVAKSGQQFLLGGSHGGFLSAHLLGQYPDVFGAASIRNPVTHLGDISGTDIPDWYFEESGLPYTPTSLMTPEIYQKLFAMSPIYHVDQVKNDVPILLCIGEKDARVANSQGLAWYHALKGRGKDIKMLTLKEDSHALDSVDASRVVFKATRELFQAARG